MDKILDPRLQRLTLINEPLPAKPELDQLPTFEVFVKARANRPWRHEGSLHASTLEMAFVFAKEQYSRRGTCLSIWVIATHDLFVTDYADNQEDIYDQFAESPDCSGEEWEVFHMYKRGTQHTHAGQVNAHTPQAALACARTTLERPKPVLNAWVGAASKFRKSTAEEEAMWQTTPEKLFREAIDYKTNEKIKAFKAAQS